MYYYCSIVVLLTLLSSTANSNEPHWELRFLSERSVSNYVKQEIFAAEGEASQFSSLTLGFWIRHEILPDASWECSISYTTQSKRDALNMWTDTRSSQAKWIVDYQGGDYGRFLLSGC
eukprot:sb/3476377/